MNKTLTAEEQKDFIDSLACNLSKGQLNILRIFIRQSNEAYHKAKVESITDEEIKDLLFIPDARDLSIAIYGAKWIKQKLLKQS